MRLVPKGLKVRRVRLDHRDQQVRLARRERRGLKGLLDLRVLLVPLARSVHRD